MEAHNAALDLGPDVMLLYVQADEPEESVLHERLVEVARRFPGQVRVHTVAHECLEGEHPEVHQAWLGGPSTVFVLREGAIVGQATGGALPVRELDLVVRHAIQAL